MKTSARPFVRIAAASATLFFALGALSVSAQVAPPAAPQLSCKQTYDHGPADGGIKEGPSGSYVTEAECETMAKNAEGAALGQAAADKDRCACSRPSSGDTGAGTRKLTPRGMGDISLQTLAGRLANILIGISGSVALLMFVYGGFLMLTSAGDDSKVDAGKKAITWATIGLAVIFGAYAIISAIFSAIGA